MRARVAVVVVLTPLLGALPAGAATIHVPSEHPTIQDGLNVASPGDTVLVAPGTYLEHDIAMAPDVCLAGATGDPEDVIIDAGGLGRVISCGLGGTATSFTALTMTGGQTSGDGGGMVVNAGHVTLSLCEFSYNTTEWYGGGLSLKEDASAALTACTFHHNEAEAGGGGIYCGWASITAEGCRFEYNNGPGSGGAVSIDQSPARFSQCEFFSNWAIMGGAVYTWGLIHPVLEFCTLTFNMATFEGAGIAACTSHTELAHCTLAYNEASDAAAAYCVDGHLELLNCVVAFNGPGEAIDCYPYYYGTVQLSCCDVYGNVGGDWAGCIEDEAGQRDNISMDPLFCLDDNPDEPYTLDWRSPCAPYSAPNGLCDQIGAWGVACGPSTGLESADERETSWGAIKAMYRP